jgi:hypothetical protein
VKSTKHSEPQHRRIRTAPSFNIGAGQYQQHPIINKPSLRCGDEAGLSHQPALFKKVRFYMRANIGMRLLDFIGLMDGNVTPERAKLHLASWNGKEHPAELYLQAIR